MTAQRVLVTGGNGIISWWFSGLAVELGWHVTQVTRGFTFDRALIDGVTTLRGMPSIRADETVRVLLVRIHAQEADAMLPIVARGDGTSWWSLTHSRDFAHALLSERRSVSSRCLHMSQANASHASVPTWVRGCSGTGHTS